MATSNSEQMNPTSSSHNRQTWKLEEAKARFSEVVRLARDKEPQHVTVRGQDAVVILSAQTFEEIAPLLKEPNLHQLLSQSPLSQLEFDSPGEPFPIRDIEL
jgi:prevent-host-death family protein